MFQISSGKKIQNLKMQIEKKLDEINLLYSEINQNWHYRNQNKSNCIIQRIIIERKFSNRLDYLEKTTNKMIFRRFGIFEVSSINQVWEITIKIHTKLVFFT